MLKFTCGAVLALLAAFALVDAALVDVKNMELKAWYSSPTCDGNPDVTATITLGGCYSNDKGNVTYTNCDDATGEVDLNVYNNKECSGAIVTTIKAKTKDQCTATGGLNGMKATCVVAGAGQIAISAVVAVVAIVASML